DHRCVGINGKNSEMHAAMGLCNLPRVEKLISDRRDQFLRYHELIDDRNVVLPKPPTADFKHNYSYCPIILPSEGALQSTMAHLESSGVVARRYFYPSLNRLPYLSTTQSCPISEDIANRIMCLPMSEDVTPALQQRIATLILESIAEAQLVAQL
ncbi:MAG: DegT/DnrJ/EryC1/StrS family aminotransferase, partial [Patescibacteria group bacterium]